MSAVWPIREPVSTQATCTNRAKTWASGRNSSVLPVPSNSSGSSWRGARQTVSRLRWVSSQPFGRPVVPEV